MICLWLIVGLPRWPSGKESDCSARDTGLIPGSGRSPGTRNGDPLQHSCLEKSMVRRAWWATLCGLTKRPLSAKFVTALLPKSELLLISWLWSPSTVILEPKKMKSDSFHFFPTYFPWSDGTRCHDLSFTNAEF